jgi:hypothetical protein
MTRQYASLVVMLACGCDPAARFADRAILWREPDTAPIAVPKSNEVYPDYVGIRDVLFLPADRELALDYGHEAVNANALDEVPDSTWFEDPRRMVDDRGQFRMRKLGGDRVERGAMLDTPDPKPPFTIIKGKGAGANLGFQVKDALGRKYLFKMDPPGLIGLDTSTEVVVSRLAWASGWKVPTETLVDFYASDLVLAPDATTKVPNLNDNMPLSSEVLARMLHSVPTAADGRIRAVASLWIEGKIIGPFAYIGRRPDDSNDRVAHEDRRDLRGFGSFSMWVNNIDSLETNTLDSYVGAPGKGHLLHYQQDVGGAFGARAEEPVAWWMGTDIYLAPSRILGSLLTLGLVRRPWEGDDVRARRARLVAMYPELGNFEWEHFEPRQWHPVLDNPAFERQTLRDRYWGTKRLLAFDDDELRGAIRSGRYRPAAADRLFEILTKRRERIARAYLGLVAALDFFRFDGDRLCFDDLWVSAGLGGESSTRYAVMGDGVIPPHLSDAGPQCVALQPREGYRVVELRIQRAGERHLGPPVRVHFTEHAGDRRILGIER